MALAPGLVQPRLSTPTVGDGPMVTREANMLAGCLQSNRDWEGKQRMPGQIWHREQTSFRQLRPVAKATLLIGKFASARS